MIFDVLPALSRVHSVVSSPIRSIKPLAEYQSKSQYDASWLAFSSLSHVLFGEEIFLCSEVNSALDFGSSGQFYVVLKFF